MDNRGPAGLDTHEHLAQPRRPRHGRRASAQRVHLRARRLQDAGEWDAFARAYLAHVDLTERERELWPHAVAHMLWEEGTWALEDNDADAWADPRQGGYLRALAVATPEDFPLPR